jgi:hypothetical protein
METPRLRFVAMAVASIALLPTPSLAADDFMTQLAKHPLACESITAKDSKDLRLALKAHEGEAIFMQHVRFRRPYEQWTTEEAIARAIAAARSPCGVAIGLKPLDARSFRNLLAEDRH